MPIVVARAPFPIRAGAGGSAAEPDRLVDVLGRVATYEAADRLVIASRVPLPRGGGGTGLAWLRAQPAATRQ